MQRQWLGQSMAMLGWSTAITGTTVQDVFFGVPGFVRTYNRLVRVMLQYHFEAQMVSDDEFDGRIPFPVGCGAYWRPEPAGALRATNWVPATGDTLVAAVCDFQPYRTSYLGVQGTAWSSEGVVEPINSSTSRDIRGLDPEGYGIAIDWTQTSDWPSSVYNSLIGVSGYVLLRTLWEKG